MKSKTIDVYFFSGTGNTYLITNMIVDNLKKNNYTVNLFNIEKAKVDDINLNHTIALAIPIAYFSTYPFIWDFIEKLPKTNGTSFFLISSFAGTAGALALQIKKAIVKKGYHPIGALNVKMPNNFAQKAVKEKKVSILLSKANIKTIHFVEELIQEKSVWKYNVITSYLFLFLLYIAGDYPVKLYRKLYPIAVNDTKCTQCGICYQVCPADTIRMYEFPRFENNCQYCLRCFAHCPEQAIYFQDKVFVPYRSADIKSINQTDI
ncbi:MAG TPA: EFR1 family ferrodoxin [Candidatus Cloacimonadota bacterium]|nr:EFR1 family ferrodoxin [Candidatus Cloacimonadota bacterium]HPK40112.1 EFR1 family ferrodoxin [Candidatus Cloacimonadota bacterium]